MKKGLILVKFILNLAWVLMAGYIHGLFFRVITGNSEIELWVPIVGIILWWVLTFVIYLITVAIPRKKERIYREKYITEVEFEDGFFGKMKFEYNSEHKILYQTEIHLPTFGAGDPELFFIAGYNESDREKIFRSLRGIYEHQSEIIDALCPKLSETATEYKEVDENGSSYTPEQLCGRVYACVVCVQNNDGCVSVIMEVKLADGELNLGGHGFCVCVNCDKKTVEFSLKDIYKVAHK